MRTAWTTTGEARATFARRGEKYGAGKVNDRAIVITTNDDIDILVVGGTADHLIAWTRGLYLDAVRAAGRENEADLIARLNARTYEHETDERSTDAEYVVDLYGASIGAHPTRDGLRIDVNTDEVLTDHYPILVEVDGHDAGTYRDDDAATSAENEG